MDYTNISLTTQSCEPSAFFRKEQRLVSLSLQDDMEGSGAPFWSTARGSAELQVSPPPPGGEDQRGQLLEG